MSEDTMPVGKQTSIDELQKEMAELKSMLASLLASKVAPEKPKPVRKPRAKKDILDADMTKQVVSAPVSKESLSPNTLTKVMSLVENVLNLSTRPHGKGKSFRFENFGMVKTMFYSELLEVIENHPNFFKAGYFFVMDGRVIEENNFHETYDHILSKEQMERVFNSSPVALELFTKANQKQRMVIIDHFTEKIIAGNSVDMNLISDMSKVSGYDIMKKIEDSRTQP